MNQTYRFSSEEIWKIVPSDPTLEASSLGRIRVIPYQKVMPYGGFKICGGTPTYGQWDGKRFLYARKGHKTRKVSRLVCEAFNGPFSSTANVCLHLDENARNNTPDNLKWGTQKENLNCPGFIKYCVNRTGKNSPTSKWKKSQKSNYTTVG